jgi:hypothetical protein
MCAWVTSTRRRALQFGHAQDDLHGHLGGFAQLAVEQGLIMFGEFDGGVCCVFLQRAVDGPPGIARC